MGLIVFQYIEDGKVIEYKIEKNNKKWKEVLDEFHFFLKGLGYNPTRYIYDDMIENQYSKDDRYMKDGTV